MCVIIKTHAGSICNR